jgi:hypothetical protein
VNIKKRKSWNSRFSKTLRLVKSKNYCAIIVPLACTDVLDPVFVVLDPAETVAPEDCVLEVLEPCII